MIKQISQIVEALRTRRTELGYSQEYMACKMGMGQNAYSKIELNSSRLTVERLLFICDLLDLNINDLLSTHKHITQEY